MAADSRWIEQSKVLDAGVDGRVLRHIAGLGRVTTLAQRGDKFNFDAPPPAERVEKLLAAAHSMQLPYGTGEFQRNWIKAEYTPEAVQQSRQLFGQHSDISSISPLHRQIRFYSVRYHRDELMQALDEAGYPIDLSQNSGAVADEDDNASMRTGAPGRPSSMHFISAEFGARQEANICERTLSKEAEELLLWLRSQHPKAPPLTAKTIANNISKAYRSWKSKAPKL